MMKGEHETEALEVSVVIPSFNEEEPWEAASRKLNALYGKITSKAKSW